jgi:hypothetical protein
MINLTPIAKKIQQRLFEKMRVLGRANTATANTPKNGELTHKKMATRSTFIRMTSGVEQPIILMGGELTYGTTDSEGFGSVGSERIMAGYDEIYGSRLIQQPKDFDFFDDTTGTENKFKRPMPGIKSADISFKGGVRALREATVSWTCWSFEDLNRLMPHFLSHGSEVLLEWGWVYDENSLQNLPTFYDFIGDRKIKRDAYTNYQKEVVNANGDFDMLVGIVKNFELTTRDDGGFDCQTILTSVGISILDSTKPRYKTNAGIYYNIKKTEDVAGLRKKFRDAKNNPDTLINLDVSTSLDTFLMNFEKYLLDYIYKTGARGLRTSKLKKGIPEISIEEDWELNLTEGTEKVIKFNNINLSYVPNEFILEWNKDLKLGRNSTVKEAWVRWGWFEDNILSKFITLVSSDTKNPPILELRSVENVLDNDGKETGELESTKIKNHPLLETVNIKNYILPGKFSGYSPIKTYLETPIGTVMGDSDRIITLAGIANNNFKAFDVVSPFVSKNIIVNNWLEMTGPNGEKIKKNSIGQRYYTKITPRSGDVEDEKYGYFRSMLINTKTIKNAFGISEENDENIRFINIRESIENLFGLLNQDISFWDFQLETDSLHPNRVKVTDQNTVNFKFKNDVKIDDSIEMSKSTKSIFNSETNEVSNDGVFFFPTWQSNSIVKRQNITAKVPDAMALSIMYGAHYDEVSTLGNPPPEIQEVEGVAMASFFKDFFEKNKNLNKQDFGIALKDEIYSKIGTSSSEDGDTQNLSKDGGNHNIRAWLKNNKDELESVYEDRITVLSAQLRAVKDDKYKDIVFDLSSPLPPPEVLEREHPEKFEKLLLGYKFDHIVFAGGVENVINSKYLDNDRMKQNYIDYISLNTGTNFSTKQVSDNTKPLLLPMELELDIDGIGGIYPGNSYHSTYLTKRYQEETVFQIFDVNHKLSDTDWVVTLSGKMRSTLGKLTKSVKLLELSDTLGELRKGQRVQAVKQIKEQRGTTLKPFGKAKNPKRSNTLLSDYENTKEARERRGQ